MVRVMGWAAVGVVLLAGSVRGETPSAKTPAPAPPPGVYVDPAWVKKPTAEDIFGVWPIEAMKQQKPGRAVIACHVNTLGKAYDCQVVEETPPGLGFGMAALALAPQLLFKPATLNGEPVDSEVRIPISWTGPLPTPSTDARTVTLTVRTWVSAPTYAEVAAAYPDKARASNAIGHVTLDCMVKLHGRLGECEALSEEPKGLGFAAAARKVADKFAAPTALPDGRRTEGMGTQIAITFPSEMASGAAPVIGRPEWLGLPTGDQLRDAFPKLPPGGPAVTARVAMTCAVVAGGHVDDCRVESESPAGQGYGAAAQRMAPFFLMSIWTVEGLPTVGGRVRIPIRYEVPAGETAGPAPAKP
jgi:TonB family protein